MLLLERIVSHQTLPSRSEHVGCLWGRVEVRFSHAILPSLELTLKAQLAMNSQRAACFSPCPKMQGLKV